MSPEDEAVRAGVDALTPAGIRAGERLLAAVWDLVEVPPIRRGGQPWPVVEDGATAPYEVELPPARAVHGMRAGTVTIELENVAPRVIDLVMGRPTPCHGFPAAGPRDARLPRT